MYSHRLPKRVIVLSLLSLASCTSGVVKPPHVFDLKHTQRIDLVIISQQPEALPIGINQLIIKNLQSSGYPVGDHEGQTFSHGLTAVVGLVSHGKTPEGFSFSAGNSDLRALEFQKMDVLPIRCTLTSSTDPEQYRELTMGFTANTGTRLDLSSEKLTDHISTVCFNVLRDVQWPKQHPIAPTVTSQPSWMPEVQIETKAVPETTETVGDEGKPVASEPRKEIIIHNQGSPVILHFGHERR